MMGNYCHTVILYFVISKSVSLVFDQDWREKTVNWKVHHYFPPVADNLA